jgi:protein TIF31
MRGSRGGTHRNKGKQKARNSSSSNGTGIEWTALTQSSLWEQILADISSYYGLAFPDSAKDSLDSVLNYFGVQKISILRSFCLKTGIQVMLREYQFNRNGGSGKSSINTFNQEDILNVFPVVKHIDPKVTKKSLFLINFFLIL